MAIDELDGVPLLTFTTSPSSPLQLLLKRILDVAHSALLMLLGLPVLLLVALAIKVTTRGNVLFRQTRCGLNGRTFTLYKFRTMVEGAEARQPDLLHLNEMDGPVFKLREDPRVTALGRFLRKFSLDELPQLWNVLRGDMSLVGPRPPIPEEVARYERWQRRRLAMKPGLTCLWQVSGRNELDFQQWMELDLEYIDTWSPWLDFKILLKTIPAVISGRGAS
jgi:exopolysaccharide biosynthesis polyprenyl glycosylphosphotransferase